MKFNDFFGACSENEHKQAYTIEGDHPEVLCGTDNAPTPAELRLFQAIFLRYINSLD